MKTFNKLPLYEGRIDYEDTGMFCISLVDEPATGSDFLYFGKEKELLKYSVENEEKHLLFGLVMAADLPIYRRNKEGYEFYIVYRPETLRQMAERYLKSGFSSNVDLNHDSKPVEGVDMVQLFIKDTEKGIVPKGFEDYADGSLFAEFKVHNEEIWQSIKNGEFKGFSLAGVFNIEETYSKQTQTKNMSKIDRIKAALRKLLAEFGEVSTDKGVVIWDGDENLKEGDSVRGMNENGEDIALEDGIYTTEDKKQIEIADGKVVSIKDIEAEVAPEEPAAEEEPAEEPKEEEKPAEEPEEEPQEEPAEEPAEEPKEEEADPRDERIAELESEIAERDARIAELEARIKELEAEPAAKSAEEEFEAQEVDDNSEIGKMRKRGYKI